MPGQNLPQGIAADTASVEANSNCLPILQAESAGISGLYNWCKQRQRRPFGRICERAQAVEDEASSASISCHCTQTSQEAVPASTENAGQEEKEKARQQIEPHARLFVVSQRPLREKGSLYVVLRTISEY